MEYIWGLFLAFSLFNNLYFYGISLNTKLYLYSSSDPFNIC